MSQIQISIDNRPVEDALRGLMQHLDDPTPVMQDIGEYLIVSTKERFQTGIAPDGSKWAPNSKLTLSRKKGNRPLIGETHRLSTEILSHADRDAVEVGSNLVYAAVQQFGAKMGAFGRYSQLSRRTTYAPTDFRHHAGTKKGFPIPWGNIPARPFLGLSDDDVAAVLDIVQEHLDQTLGTATG